MRIRTMTAPPRYRELEEEIETVRKEKETSIEAQEFEKAAALRDKERKLTQKRWCAPVIVRGKSGAPSCVPPT